MTITIIILAYVANVFLNRWLNKIVYKSNKVILPVLWLFSLIGTAVLIYEIVDNWKIQDTWFTGKNW